MIHHNRPFIPYYGPYHHYMEDGMPGTPLKVWGFLVGLIGGIAGGIVAISGLNPIIGAFVALGAVIAGIILAGLGMAKNYKENKKFRELKLKYLQQNLQQKNQLLDNNPVLPIAPLQPFQVAPVPIFPNDNFPPMVNIDRPNFVTHNDDNKKSFNRPLINNEKIFTPPIINKQIPENININKSMEPSNDNIPNSKRGPLFPFLNESSEPGFAKGTPLISSNNGPNSQNRPPFQLFGNDLNKEADDINTAQNEKKDLGNPMLPLFANKEAPNGKTAPSFLQPNLKNNKNISSDDEEDYEDEEEEREEAEVPPPEKKEVVAKNNAPGSLLSQKSSQTSQNNMKLPPLPDFFKGNPLFAPKSGGNATNKLLQPKPIYEGVKINKNNAEQNNNNLNKE